MNGDQLEGWQVAPGLELGCNLRSCRKRAVGLRPFIDVALHIPERLVPPTARVEFHGSIAPMELVAGREQVEFVFFTF
jgi:hypothetical protein